jgi:hypothetical protein
MHELIHALAPHAEHVQEPSLFAASIYRAHSFDAPASAALCREFACETFAPEPSEGP